MAGTTAAQLEKLVADSASMQGRHSKQEDRHVKVPDLTKAAKALKMPIDHLDQPCALFAMYDGHRGHLCAEFAAKGFHGKLLKKLSADASPDGNTEESICKVLTDVCEELDVEFFAKHRTGFDGCTLAVALISGSRLFIAWVGNCRCLLGRLGPEGVVDVVTATHDHRPSVEDEAARIKAAGGVVIDYGNGFARLAHDGYEERIREILRAQAQGLGVVAKEPVALDVSRALGDRDFKGPAGKALLVATPGVKMVPLDASHKFLVLVSGGLPMVMLDSDVVYELDLLRDQADLAADVRAACGALVQEAYGRGSEHNLTVTLARLQWHGATGAAYARKLAAVDKAEKAAKVLLEDKGDEKKSAIAASKRRRLEAAASVNAQKQAAFERSGAAASFAAEEAKKNAEMKKMYAEVEAEKAAAFRKARAEAIARAAEEARKADEQDAKTNDSGSGLDSAEAFFAARKAQKRAPEEGTADAAKGLDAAEDFFAKRRAQQAAASSSSSSSEPKGLDAAEDFFAKRRAEQAAASSSSSEPKGLDAAEDFFAKRRAEQAAASSSEPKGFDAAGAFFAANSAQKDASLASSSAKPKSFELAYNDAGVVAASAEPKGLDAAAAFFAARRAQKDAAVSSDALAGGGIVKTAASPESVPSVAQTAPANAEATQAPQANAAPVPSAAAPSDDKPAEGDDDDLTFL